MIKRPILFARRHAVAFLALFVALGGGAQAVLAGIRPNSVGAAQIKRNAVGASEIKAGAVGESELKDGAVDTAKLAKGAVGLDRLGFASGTTGAVAQGPAITLAPRGCADVAARRVTLTAAGAPTPGETVGWDIDFFAQVRNPTDPGRGTGPAATFSQGLLLDGRPFGPTWSQTVGEGEVATVPGRQFAYVKASPQPHLLSVRACAAGAAVSVTSRAIIINWMPATQ